MKKVWLILIMMFLPFAAIMNGQPRQKYNEYVLSTSKGEVKVIEEIGAFSVGVSLDDLLQMVFQTDEIPNHYCTGTRIHLNLSGVFSRIERAWLHEEHKVRGVIGPFYFVSVDVFVYRSVDEAKKTFHRWSHSTMPDKPRMGSVSGIPIGEECSNTFPFGGIMFRVGRVIAIVNARIKNVQSLEDNAYFIEALCLGIEYLLLQNPKVGAFPSKAKLFLASRQNGEIILLHSVPVGRWGVLKNAGVRSKECRDEKEGHVYLYLTRDKYWVKVRAFSWEMETDKGKVKLDRPVFTYKGELIVPLRQVAEALGISVLQKGQTIALLPK